VRACDNLETAGARGTSDARSCRLGALWAGCGTPITRWTRAGPKAFTAQSGATGRAFRMGRLSVGTLPAGSCFRRGTADPRLLASAFEFRGHGVVSFKRNCEILGQAAHQFVEASWRSGFAETVRRIDPSPYFSRNPRQAKGSEAVRRAKGEESAQIDYGFTTLAIPRIFLARLGD
jgi:hypothetical protein